MAGADFHTIGLGEPHAIAATHGSGCEELMDIVLAGLPHGAAEDEQNEDGRIRIAVIGRPNVGKSTLINRLIGDERLITSEVAGTTRDSILVPFERDGREFTLIDTAGVRRRAKIDDEIEILSVSKTLQAIAEAHVVTMVVDAQDSIGEQDASVLGLALSRGRALILAVNKWDNIPHRAARGNPPAADAQDRFRAVRADALRERAAWHRRRRPGRLDDPRLRRGDAPDEDAGSSPRRWRRPWCSTSRPSCAAGASGCATRTRAARIRRASSCTAARRRTCPSPTSATSRTCSASEFDLFATPVSVEFRSDVNPFLKDKPKEKRGLKTSQKERRERRIKKDRAKRPPKKKGGAQPPARRAAWPRQPPRQQEVIFTDAAASAAFSDVASALSNSRRRARHDSVARNTGASVTTHVTHKSPTDHSRRLNCSRHRPSFGPTRRSTREGLSRPRADSAEVS